MTLPDCLLLVPRQWLKRRRRAAVAVMSVPRWSTGKHDAHHRIADRAAWEHQIAKARQRTHAGEITIALDTRPWFLAPLQTRDGARFIGYSSTLQKRATTRTIGGPDEKWAASHARNRERSPGVCSSMRRTSTGCTTNRIAERQSADQRQAGLHPRDHQRVDTNKGLVLQRKYYVRRSTNRLTAML